ncbi:MAG TPA: Rieske (2Fe-2S) protein [Chloroflexota bacterium]|jgi:cytochrome b6-f complex iron-sulfur subunit|nr:Rieske (2Fe-2S) protein [Chloroflexota bacterium]
MMDSELLDTLDEEQPAGRSRSGFLLAGLLGLSGLFGIFYFISTLEYVQDSVPQRGSTARRLRVLLKSLTFANGVAGPINYATNEGIFLTRQGSRWLALEQTCPHQGCPVDWHPDTARFVCPCHGSEYDRLGRVVQGPSARGLYPHDLQVEPGALVIEGRV